MVYSYNSNMNFGNSYNTTTTVTQKSLEQAASKEVGNATKTSDSVFSGLLGAAAFEGVFKSYSYMKDVKAANEGIKLGGIFRQAGKDISTNFGTIKTQGAGTWRSLSDAKTAFSNAWTQTSANALKDTATKYAEAFAKVDETVAQSYASLAEKAAKATTKEGIAEIEAKLAQLNIETAQAGKTSSKIGQLINKSKFGQKVTSKVAETANKCPKTLGKFTKYAKGSGVGIMMVFDGAIELLTNVVPTFKQLGAKSGVKQIFKSGTKVAASAGGWVAGTATATAIATAICPGIGTVAGAIIGMVGGMLGSNVASKLVTKIFGKSELEKAADKQQTQATKITNQQMYQQMYQQYPQTYSYIA